ncbi:MAG TPA: DUF1667 domain-containing protein [Sphaerochaeta sp.]|jgi:CxxC motif-containing protein|nr:DUF1667 domain-containing protein [Spirochaetales bacterium]HPY11868.1 DUF1667 domain-containing protein [Sphaerochaeta sp.]HQB91029.1 DUF1667 domain-containing protein [Sphaerochaeta sp.]
MEKIITCTVCPVGCQITVTGVDGKVETISGHTCKRGIPFATDEFLLPKRILTSTVRLAGSDEPLLPVRSDKPIPKDKLFACMEAVKKVQVVAPIQMGDIIIADILGLGSNMIATRSVEKVTRPR